MGPVVLCVINHVRLWISDETKTTRPFGFGILHNDHIYNFSPFLEMSFKRFISSAVVKPTDENFAMDLGLILKVGQSFNKMADSVASTQRRNKENCNLLHSKTQSLHNDYDLKLKRIYQFCGSSSINQANQTIKLIWEYRYLQSHHRRSAVSYLIDEF